MTSIIPNFYDDMDLIDDSSMPLPPFDFDDEGIIHYNVDCDETRQKDSYAKNVAHSLSLPGKHALELNISANVTSHRKSTVCC